MFEALNNAKRKKESQILTCWDFLCFFVVQLFYFMFLCEITVKFVKQVVEKKLVIVFSFGSWLCWYLRTPAPQDILSQKVIKIKASVHSSEVQQDILSHS